MRIAQAEALPSNLAMEAIKIGARLARLRVARNTSQTEAALRAGISRNTAYRLEKGDPSVALGQLLRYLDAIAPGKTLQNFLTEDDSTISVLEATERRIRIHFYMIKQENLAVFAYIDDAFVPAGLLTLHEENTSVVASEFAYGTKYLTRHQALEVDPVSLSIADKSAVRQKKILPNAGLKMFGGIRDASPDAWGRLTELVLLMYEQAYKHPKPDGEDIPASLEAIFDAGASLGGARPKATIRDEEGILWLAKFQSRDERLNVPEIEAATMKLAQMCGMTVPDVKLIKVGDRDVMLIRRFDRYWISAEKKYNSLAEVVVNQPGEYLSKERRLHFVSGLTMLACDEMESREKSYGDLAQGIRRYCHHSVIRENNRELFTRMVYNIFVSNDDDHPRNHGFLWDPYIAGWRLSPLYDVMPRPTRATDRFLFLGVGQDGRSATLDNAISAKEMFNLSLQDAAFIIAKKMLLDILIISRHQSLELTYLSDRNSIDERPKKSFGGLMPSPPLSGPSLCSEADIQRRSSAAKPCWRDYCASQRHDSMVLVRLADFVRAKDRLSLTMLAASIDVSEP
eukprot:gene19194-19567_t